VDVPDDVATTTMVATPVDFHGTPWEARSTAPELGQHTREVLAELGRTDAEIASMVATGVVRLPVDES
jgi:crotonobetainyl-CoA:carnitine CoA-transferase CaiB-like acyl-CoA transferase